MRLFIILGKVKTTPKFLCGKQDTRQIFLVFRSSLYVLSFNGSFLYEACIFFA